MKGILALLAFISIVIATIVASVGMIELAYRFACASAAFFGISATLQHYKVI